jgi:hypothetical protein
MPLFLLTPFFDMRELIGSQEDTVLITDDRVVLMVGRWVKEVADVMVFTDCY